jgi:outer membrane protein assembly factor BamE
MQKNIIIIYMALTGFFITGCASILPEPHKIDIQQGNQVKQKNLHKLKLGMTRAQVRFVLGTPLLMDGFNANRWDYMYYLKSGKGQLKKSRIVLHFEADLLANIDLSHYHPEQHSKAHKHDNIEQLDEIKVGHTH